MAGLWMVGRWETKSVYRKSEREDEGHDSIVLGIVRHFEHENGKPSLVLYA